jgi:hypothetical protein
MGQYGAAFEMNIVLNTEMGFASSTHLPQGPRNCGLAARRVGKATTLDCDSWRRALNPSLRYRQV